MKNDMLYVEAKTPPDPFVLMEQGQVVARIFKNEKGQFDFEGDMTKAAECLFDMIVGMMNNKTQEK